MTTLNIRNALLLAGSLIAFSLAMAYAEKTGFIEPDTARRAVQVAMGLLVVFYANLAPKTLEPLSTRCAPTKVQAMQRFSGRALFLGGLGYSLAWLVAPLEHATGISMAILASSLLLVLARFAWMLRSRAPSQPPSEH